MTCTATDDSGNTASGSFNVNVLALLELGISLDGVGSVNPKTGVATLAGTIDCSRPIQANLTGTLQQLFAHRVVVSG